MLRIAIVDDEKSFLASLKKRILAICDWNDYLVSISTTTDPYSVLENELYKHNDIIFLVKTTVSCILLSNIIKLSK